MDQDFEKIQLKLDIDKKKGRVLRTLSPRREGDLIIQDTAMAYIVLPEHQKSNCQSCLQSPSNLLRCSACKIARYCNIICQKKDWETHRVECELIRVSKRTMPTCCMLLIRLLCVNQEILKRTKEAGPFCSEIGLLGHQDNLPEDTREKLAQFVLEMTELLTTRLDTSPEISYRVLEKILCNTFSVLKEELIPYAVGVYPLASMLNHSCTPNCVQFFSGDQVYIRSVVDVKPGEELTVSYIDLIQEVDKRRNELEKGYFFRCECPRCISEEIGFKINNEKQDIILAEIAKKRVRKDWRGILDISNVVTDSEVTIIDKIKLTEQIMDAHIELEHWEEAINDGKSLAEYYNHSTVPKHFPLVALNRVKLAKLLLHINNLNEANEYIEGAIKSIKVCYGEKGSIYTSLCEMYGWVQMELNQIRD